MNYSSVVPSGGFNSYSYSYSVGYYSPVSPFGWKSPFRFQRTIPPGISFLEGCNAPERGTVQYTFARVCFVWLDSRVWLVRAASRWLRPTHAQPGASQQHANISAGRNTSA